MNCHFPWGIIGETVHKSPMNCNYKWVVGCGKQLVWLSGEVLPALHSLKQSLSICCTFSFLRNYFSKLVQQGWENTFVNGSCGWHCELRVCQDLWKFSEKNQCDYCLSQQREIMQKKMHFIYSHSHGAEKETNGKKEERHWKVLPLSLSL